MTPRHKPILICIHGKLRCGACRESAGTEQITAISAHALLEELEYRPDQIKALLENPRVHLAAAEALQIEKRAPTMAPAIPILRAYVAWLDAHAGAP